MNEFGYRPPESVDELDIQPPGLKLNLAKAERQEAALAAFEAEFLQAIKTKVLTRMSEKDYRLPNRTVGEGIEEPTPITDPIEYDEALELQKIEIEQATALHAGLSFNYVRGNVERVRLDLDRPIFLPTEEGKNDFKTEVGVIHGDERKYPLNHPDFGRQLPPNPHRAVVPEVGTGELEESVEKHQLVHMVHWDFSGLWQDMLKKHPAESKLYLLKIIDHVENNTLQYIQQCADTVALNRQYLAAEQGFQSTIRDKSHQQIDNYNREQERAELRLAGAREIRKQIEAGDFSIVTQRD